MQGESKSVAWWKVLGVKKTATVSEIERAYARAWSSVGDGNPEFYDNDTPMTHETFMKMSAEIRAIDAAYHAAINKVKK